MATCLRGTPRMALDSPFPSLAAAFFSESPFCKKDRKRHKLMWWRGVPRARGRVGGAGAPGGGGG